MQTDKIYKKSSSTNTEPNKPEKTSKVNHIEYTGCPRANKINNNPISDMGKVIAITDKAMEIASKDKAPIVSVTSNKTVNQILILGDDLSKNVVLKLKKKLCDSKYKISAIVKPGALLHQVIENMELLTKNFTINDYVIIVGGSNDIDSKTTPSFRTICKKLKLCTHTNVIFSSVPFFKNNYKNYLKNSHIYKYNVRLNEFLFKFNKCVEGQTRYMEINNNNTSKQIRGEILEGIINILNKPFQRNNLRFIKTSEVYSEKDKTQKDENVATIHVCCGDNTEESENGTDNFLYPRLSQMSLIQ